MRAPTPALAPLRLRAPEAAARPGPPATSRDVVPLPATSGEAELVLEVPAGALPPGVSAADIAVTALDLD